MAKVNVSIPDELLEQVDEIASELHRSRSGLVQEATARYVAEALAERERKAREEEISAAFAGMRRLSTSVPAGEDTTALIRRDRDSKERK